MQKNGAENFCVTFNNLQSKVQKNSDCVFVYSLIL